MSAGRSGSDATARIAIIEDQHLLGSLLGDWLSTNGFVAFAVTEQDERAILEVLAERPPDIVLIDGDRLEGGIHPLALIGPILELGAIVVLLATSEDRVAAGMAIEAGASGVIHKGSSPEHVAAAVEKLARGRSLLSPAERSELIVELRRHRMTTDRERAPFRSLTARESEALAAVCEGRSAAEIAERWHVSIATVRSHIRSVLLKLDVGSQLEAAALARRVGWPWRDDRELTSSSLMMTGSER